MCSSDLKGPVATILVQKGTLHVGDFIAAGACNGKVRAMMDDKGRRVKEAGPSTPVEILGLGDVPNAGEILMSFESDKEAKNFAGAFVTENKSRLLEETKGKLSLDNLFDQIQASDLKELPIIVKADVQGSVEAVKQSLTKLSNEEVIVKVIHGGVGTLMLGQLIEESRRVHEEKMESQGMEEDRKSTRLNSSHITRSRMPSSA